MITKAYETSYETLRNYRKWLYLKEHDAKDFCSGSLVAQIWPKVPKKTTFPPM